MDGLILPLLLMLVVALPLILSTRKQKKLMAEQQEMQSSLTEGDRVMTTSGLYATVADASDDTTIDLEIAEGVVTTWLRQAVRERIVADTDEDIVDTETSADADSAQEELVGAEKSDEGAQVAPPIEQSKK
ncbi:preprotein translocase subunit YajC [Saccharomonospora azurea]|uniref:Preprotein translocase, YajC subunit n=1 Tax=Saccharomonospora azurea NA-128 TaxID=882081 RepID=H8G6W7_9PSEU|nr:preprotein translocase subunit YajC [Saccharomonospora azurea]EHK81140.1 preprotein translocase, YajC subunit [Saccharomonospora azurea SZMC 14600]EHY91350.1 preprotein translocase, YajC subunit [Saccharomonospora azurea NA-128]